jgi:hypothetical protein
MKQVAPSGQISPPAKPILYLPSDGLTKINESASLCFKGMADCREYFLRDGVFVKPRSSETEGLLLNQIDNHEFPSQLEYVFEVAKKGREKNGKVVTNFVNCDQKEAKVLLSCTDEMLRYSLPLRILAASPVIIERNGAPSVLQKGYHREEGGIYVINGFDIPSMTLAEAKERLLDLFADYVFVSPSDKSRAIAQLLSPALKLGNLLPGADFPLDVALADQSQGGKTHRMRFTALAYGEKAYALTKTRGGVGSLDEAVATGLIAGKLFILVDNVRGEIDSQILESILRGTGSISARVPYRKAVLAQTGRSVWQVTSNAAQFTVDLANRSIVTNHKKQPQAYKHKSKAGWGDQVYGYIREHQGEYLGAVHTIVGEWITRGKPRTDENRHNFRAWVQSLDYIVSEILELPKLMEDHDNAHRALSSPSHAWLRQIIIEAVKTHGRPCKIRAGEMGDIADCNAIPIPNLRNNLSADDDLRNKAIGKLLIPIFREAKTVKIENFHIERIEIARLPGCNHSGFEYRIF